jgi:hypothetical protein
MRNAFLAFVEAGLEMQLVKRGIFAHRFRTA